MDPTPLQNVRLLVGPPGVGKSTVLRQVVERLGERAGGFMTHEVRENGERSGFEIVTLEGERASLASKQHPSPYPAGQPFGAYTVNLDAVEQVAVPALRRAVAARQLVVIDEIGPMELFSERFQEVVWALLESDVPIFGTIVERPHPVADQFKAHPRVRLIEVTPENRRGLAAALCAAL